MNEWIRDRRRAGVLTGIGAVTLFAGLMAGPTPGPEPADALRNIERTRTLYMATNVVDLVGIAILASGLLALARLQAQRPSAPLRALLAGEGVVAGSVLIAAVLAVQSTLDPALASRFVMAGGQDPDMALAIAAAVFEAERGVFGVGLAIEMAGIACLAATFRGDPEFGGRRVWWGIGTLAASLAALLGLATLFIDDVLLTRGEASLSLVTLLWLAGTGFWLTRRFA